MKKEYVKPEIVFESFKMSTSIANGTCADGYQTNFSSLDACEYTYNGMTIFGSTNTDCGYPVDDATCYHIPVDGITLFNS